MAAYIEEDLDQLDHAIRNTPPGPEREKLVKQADRMAEQIQAQEAQEAAEAAKRAQQQQAEEARHQRARELEDAKRRNALEKEAAARETAAVKAQIDREKRAAKEAAAADTRRRKAKEQRREALSGLKQRNTIGRKSSNDKMLGDALTTAAVGVVTAGWTATRPSAQGFFWGLGFTGLGAIAMLESRPGTFLESGAAGMLGANAAITVLHLFNLAK